MAKVFDIAFKLGGELTSSFKNAFGSAESTMSKLGAAAVAIGGAVGFGQLAAQIGEMDNALKQLSAQTGTYGADMEELGGIAENLFRNNYGENFDEVTAALANVKQNMHNLDNGELERMTGDAIMFAKTFDSDINEVTRAAQNMMENFGVSSTTSMDLFTTGMQRGLNFSDEMLDNVSEYAPLFASMGYSAEEYFGIMERGSKAGVYNLDYVNDVMKEFQIRAKDGSKATADAMKGLSKESQGVWKSFLAGNGTVSDVAGTVVNELKNMDDQIAANQIAVSLFGTKWEDLEADAMYAMLGTQEAMTGFEGAMDKVNQVQFDSFGSAVSGIGRILFMDLVYPLGEQVLPHLNNFGQFLKDNLPAAIETTKSVLSSIAPIAISLGAAFLAYRGTMMAVVTYQKMFNLAQIAGTAVMRAYRTAMLASTFAGGGLRGVLAGLRSGMMALNTAFLANPIGLVVIAIAGLAAGFVLLYQKSETFRTAVEPLLTVLKTAFVEVLTQVKTAFAAIVPAISNIANMALPLLISVIQTIIPIIVMIVQTAVPLIVAQFQLIAGIIQNVVIPALNFLMPIITTVFAYIQMAISNGVALITGIIQAGMALLKGDWSGAWEIIKGTATTIMNNIIGFFSGIDLFSVGKAIIDGLINGIKSMGGAVIGAISGMIPEPIKGAASKLLGAIPGFATGGVVASPTLAWVGEGGDTESIIPWNNSQRSKDLWYQTGDALGMWDQMNTAPEDNPFDIDSPSFGGGGGGNGEGGMVVHVTDNRQVVINGKPDPGQVEREMDNSNKSFLNQLETEIKDKKRGEFD